MKILANLGTHLMMIMLAVALWWYATDKRTAQIRDLKVPIRVAVPSDRIVVKQSADSVSMSLRGPQRTVEQVSHRKKLGEIEAVVNLTARTRDMGPQKEFSVLLTHENLTGLPPDARLIQLQPDRVEVIVVRRAAKRLAVRPRLEGQPAPGYQILGEPYVHPNKVQVWGPKTLLDEAEAIYTKPIDIAGVTEDANRTFPWLVPIHPELTDQEGKPAPVRCDEQVWIYMRMGRVLAKKTIDNVAVKILTTPSYAHTVKVKDDHISLKVIGPKHILDKLTAADLTAYVKVADLRPAVAPYQQTLVCALPPDVLLDQDPPTVDVDIPLPKTQTDNQ